MVRWNAIQFLLISALFALLAGVWPLRASDTNLEEQVQSLREQNAALQQQVQKQGDQLDVLSQKIKELETGGVEHDSAAAENSALPKTTGSLFQKVSISGEGGVSFFKTGSQGFAPNSEFRVDEARLFIESPIWKEVYFYGEVDLATWENNNLNVKLGELYLDFQDVSQLWGRNNQLNFRAGRMDIPFGEEYLYRNDIDNVLISRSLPDLWGIDPGVELYGTVGPLCYVVAVQNGSGANGVEDFNGDKSVAGRIGYDPARWLHFSVSGMRTGDLNAQQDVVSALWFGNGFFRSLGSPATTLFHADLVEGDVSANWSGGHLRAFGGYARYNDNDPTADNGRNIFYYSVEGTQDLSSKFYAAARFSQILAADKGFPIVGYGNFGTYFFNTLSTDLWRLSLGLGYRFSRQLVIKAEYSFERGEEVGGAPRDHEDFVGTEAAFQF
jgi:hypothetical protein